MRDKIFPILVLTVANCAAAWFAVSVLLPEHYLPLWLPGSGIALAALMRYGFAATPAVFSGALLLHWLAASHAQLNPDGWTLLAALASTLGALLALWLARRLITLPNSLDMPQAILRLLLFVAPAGALAEVAIGLPIVVWAGALPAASALPTAIDWWLGSLLGITIVTPVALSLIGQPVADWAPRRITLGLPIVLLCLLTLSAHLTVRDGRLQTEREEFLRDAERMAKQVEHRLYTQLENLLAIERFVSLSLGFSRADFYRFTQPFLQRHPGTQNFSWNPLVRDAERQGFEAAVRFNEQWPDFGIRDRDDASPDRTVRAPRHDEYLPLLYVEPLTANTGVLGLNPLSIPASREAIEHTRQTRKPVASAPFTLTQEQVDQKGVVIYLAVHQTYNGHERFVGTVSSALRMDDILSATLHDLSSNHLSLCLIDNSIPESRQRLSGPDGCEHSSPTLNRQPALGLGMPMEFASRQWLMQIHPTPLHRSVTHSGAEQLAIVAGLAGTTAIAALLLLVTGHSRRIGLLVQQRTAQLAATTLDLERQRGALTRAQDLAAMGSWEATMIESHAPLQDPLTEHLQCSSSLIELLTLNKLAPQSLAELRLAFHDEDRQRFDLMLAAVAQHQKPPGADLRSALNPERILHVIMEGVWQAHHLERILGTAQDVTAQRKAEQEIRQLALFDLLTGLPNRSNWISNAQLAISVAHRHGDMLAVLFLDLDQFKTVNDSLGHAIGDRLLTVVAQRLSASIREGDALARLGGDEFVLLLPRIRHPEDAARTARKILDTLSAPVVLDEHQLNPSVSIGIALYPTDGESIETLLKHADTAMYSAKEAGRNTYHFFTPEMNARALDRMMLENGLRRALERSDLEVHYQAQIDGASGQLVGAEALLRWRHPELGQIPPDRFIPVAENCGLIVPLGFWVMRTCFEQQREWQRAGIHGTLLAINISALQFMKADFLETVESLIEQTGVDPALIEFEITESALMQPTDELLQRLNRLVDMGIHLSLDDFGTGYSSLAYLKRLPIHRLKLDRSFVKDLPGDQEDAAIASAAISMAVNLGIQVVAEGVETDEQRTFLLARGCTLMQGYLFSRPLPVSEFEQRYPRSTGEEAAGMTTASGGPAHGQAQS